MQHQKKHQKHHTKDDTFYVTKETFRANKTLLRTRIHYMVLAKIGLKQAKIST